MASDVRQSEVAIWERVIHPRGRMSAVTARHVLGLKFSVAERRRMKDLLARNRRGKLSPEEIDELDNYCRVGTVLSGLKSRARQILKSRSKST